jgi:drug/metabolite transporter (DMT)-like permease
MFGLTATPAAVASLLLNLEGVFTALLAWVFFQEQYDRRIVLGLAAITAGAVLLAGTGTWAWSSFWGPLAVAGACLAWSLDNNLSRKVALGDPVWIAMVKGLAAGGTNLAIASWQYGIFPDITTALLAGLLGFLSYGASLVLFLKALRYLGAARTGAYFSVAPFVGVLVSVILFREEISFQFLAAACFMAWGIWLHFTEHHEHGHAHEPVQHEHTHLHGLHHHHPHADAWTACAPHCHWHVHFPLSHRHEHFPDTNHRHRH